MTFCQILVDSLLNKYAVNHSRHCVSVLPELIKKCVSMDLSLRHGAILSAGEVVHALAKLAWLEGK